MASSLFSSLLRRTTNAEQYPGVPYHKNTPIKSFQLSHLPVVVFDGRQESDDPVVGGEVAGDQLGQVAEEVAPADGDEGRHVGRVGGVHLHT